jgi:small subunit ribosomal protein S3
VSSARRRAQRPAEEVEAAEEPTPLVKEADPEFERLLAEEEAIEASLQSKSADDKFRPEDAD